MTAPLSDLAREDAAKVAAGLSDAHRRLAACLSSRWIKGTGFCHRFVGRDLEALGIVESRIHRNERQIRAMPFGLATPAPAPSAPVVDREAVARVIADAIDDAGDKSELRMAEAIKHELALLPAAQPDDGWRLVPVKPIRTETDYAASLALLETLMDAEPNSPESDHLGVLAALIEQYEDKRFPIPTPPSVLSEMDHG